MDTETLKYLGQVDSVKVPEAGLKTMSIYSLERCIIGTV